MNDNLLLGLAIGTMFGACLAAALIRPPVSESRVTMQMGGRFADDPAAIVFSSTSAWEKGKGLLMLGHEYEIVVVKRTPLAQRVE